MWCDALARLLVSFNRYLKTGTLLVLIDGVGGFTEMVLISVPEVDPSMSMVKRSEGPDDGESSLFIGIQNGTKVCKTKLQLC